MVPSDTERDETPAQRLDRNWNELLQELRVSQTGVQILLAFLLALPFQQRFETLGTGARWLYVVVVILVVVSAVFNLAPVIIHRVLFRRHLKDDLLRVSDGLTKASFVALAFAIIGGVVLALHLVIGSTAVAVIAAGLALLILVWWLIVPRVLLGRSRARSEPHY